MPEVNVHAYDHLIRLVRIAKGLESGGLYNAAKLYWAEAFSQEVRTSNQQGIPRSPDSNALDREMETAIATLQATGAKPDLLAALRRGRQAAQENRTIPRSEIPEVYVCRDCGEIFLDQLPQRCPSCGARALTFREFPPMYFLEPLTPKRALDALASAPDEIEHTVRGLSEEQMAQRPRPGRWAIRDVLAHLLLAQELLGGRVDKMLADENPSLHAQATWRIDGEDAASARESLGRFRASREATVARLKALSLQDWLRTGEHEEFGQVTILQQASYFAKHERYHLPRMESTRRAIEASRA